MRILFVHTIGRKKYGGGERWVVNAAAGLKSKGHEVYIISKPNSIIVKKAEEKKLTTIPFNIVSNLSLYHAYMLSRFFRKKKIDVVISKGRDLAIAGLASKWGGNPLVIRRSGSPPRGRARKHVFLTRWLADGVITNTKTICDFYINKGFQVQDYVKVIYNGLKIYDNITAYDYKELFPGKTIVLCVGRLVAEKGYFYLIDALPIIKEVFPDMLFFIIGEGKDKTKMVSYAKKKGVENMICFAGYIDQPVSYYKGCDFFVHPSLFEGMPNVAMEAMAYGKPVIMTSVNGAEELSDKGKYAWLIPPANPNALAKAIINAMQNKNKFLEMGKRAQQYVKNNFSMEKMTDSLEKFIIERYKDKVSEK